MDGTRIYRLEILTPEARFAELRPASGILWIGGEIETDDDIRGFVAEFHATISNVDHNVGVLINWLQDRGVLDDTILDSLSDHEDMLSQHG